MATSSSALTNIAMASRPVFRFIKPRQIRRLSLHQHQSQSLLQQSGVPIPRGIVAKNPSEVVSAVKDLGSSVVSPQLLRQRNAQVAASAEDATRITKRYNGEYYVSEAAPDGQSWYLAMTIDRENYCPAVIVSKYGGKDIQTIVSEHPESISTFDFALTEGVTEDLVAAVAGAMQIQDRQNLKDILKSLHSIFASKDATMLEITSLTQGKNGKFVAVDSNFTFDDDAGKRQKNLFKLRDKAQEVKDEVEAEKHGLVYIRMDGNIGNVVNGAGLAMATNDAVSLAGGKSANFLDAGGQATKETMIQAFSIILRDERVKTILVNIYGGITRCDMIAESIIGAAAEMDINVPMVVRLQGTNSYQGLKLLEEANLGLHVESDFGRAAERAVELAETAT